MSSPRDEWWSNIDGDPSNVDLSSLLALDDENDISAILNGEKPLEISNTALDTYPSPSAEIPDNESPTLPCSPTEPPPSSVQECLEKQSAMLNAIMQILQAPYPIADSQKELLLYFTTTAKNLAEQAACFNQKEAEEKLTQNSQIEQLASLVQRCLNKQTDKLNKIKDIKFKKNISDEERKKLVIFINWTEKHTSQIEFLLDDAIEENNELKEELGKIKELVSKQIIILDAIKGIVQSATINADKVARFIKLIGFMEGYTNQMKNFFQKVVEESKALKKQSTQKHDALTSNKRRYSPFVFQSVLEEATKRQRNENFPHHP